MEEDYILRDLIIKKIENQKQMLTQEKERLTSILKDEEINQEKENTENFSESSPIHKKLLFSEKVNLQRN